ncbi:hypothetical protein TVAG_115410 [Trichomonas vaginalis G3]|uniref:Uncharacterized protein n=1 Tax=Trichomonas vaginalis (strain ATCC PRA-98 / G3) TaxID=412133 RepID=A2F7H9_TRIV3|nr:gamete expressed 1 family [Trichomonas vaginalis G3]EAX99137.1 hypothetical protein TVAG_115410 [Trichomonas vaginalis G3]KAI5549191.1 gamete expressed 1 family [Trichomonas vaginalis G3]|eukprot:XP_001312067.1 hypothetical protein [Trichomonas vaginalis G3]
MLNFLFIGSLCDEIHKNEAHTSIVKRNEKKKKITELIDFQEVKNKYPAIVPLASLIETIDVSESDCYTNAVTDLKINCNTIEQKQNEQLRKNLSLRFTQCFFKASNKYDESYFIDTSNMPTHVYNIYITFDQHITNLCFFARGEAFNAQTTEQLITLFNNAVHSAAVVENLTTEFNKSSENLQNAIDKISETLKEGKDSLEQIHTKILEFQINIGDVSFGLDLLVKHIDRLKIYILVLLSAFITAYYLPEILIPVSLITILLFFFDKSLANRYIWWDESLLRKLFKALYLAACTSYPIYLLFNYIYGLIESIIETMYPSRRRNIHIPSYRSTKKNLF